MTDPAVGKVEGYEPYDRGVQQDIWMKLPDGSQSLGLV
jgi:alpha-glucosidase